MICGRCDGAGGQTDALGAVLGEDALGAVNFGLGILFFSQLQKAFVNSSKIMNYSKRSGPFIQAMGEAQKTPSKCFKIDVS